MATVTRAHQQSKQSRLLTLFGLVIALGLPMLAIVGSNVWPATPAEAAAAILYRVDR